VKTKTYVLIGPEGCTTLGQAVVRAYAQAPKGAKPTACLGRFHAGRLVGVTVRFEGGADATP
jgi:hypothetical protein